MRSLHTGCSSQSLLRTFLLGSSDPSPVLFCTYSLVYLPLLTVVSSLIRGNRDRFLSMVTPRYLFDLIFRFDLLHTINGLFLVCIVLELM